MKPNIYRAWINQPSTLQPFHKMHGAKCIVVDSGDGWVEAWFVEGPLHMTEMPRDALSRVFNCAAREAAVKEGRAR